MKKLTSLLATAVLSLGICSSALAAEAGCLLGVVNMQQVLQNYPGIGNILQEINAEKARIQADVNAKAISSCELSD